MGFARLRRHLERAEVIFPDISQMIPDFGLISDECRYPKFPPNGKGVERYTPNVGSAVGPGVLDH